MSQDDKHPEGDDPSNDLTANGSSASRSAGDSPPQKTPSSNGSSGNGSSGNGAKSGENLGLAGKTARAFIHSPLSPLLYVAMLAMGLLGLIATPRQEDPQISVPMIDIMVQYPGASAQQVSNLAMQPLERIMSEIPGVKHVYSAAQRGQGIVTVEFEVGEQMGPSLVKVNDKIASNMDKIPPGVMPPMVKTKGIDDVPIVTLTIWSKDVDGNGQPDVDDGQLRLLAQDVLQVLKEVKNTGNSFIVGGRREQITVDVWPERLSSYQISLGQVANTITTANAETTAGGVESSGSHFSVTTGSFLKNADDINRLVVGTYNDVPVYVHDLGRVRQGPEDADQMVAYYTGPAAPKGLVANGEPAVTIAIAKKPLTNGVTVADAIIDKVEELRGTRIPYNVEVSVTRNYGETADEKVSELIFKLFVATFFVFLLVLLAFRALKPAIVVMLVIPVVLLMTIFVAWITDYTIDRVSLFALIFSIGILVDDAIVVIENIYRRWLEEGKTDEFTAIDAVREVGNPTILATFTVIAALLPMGFVSGMMGPYMEPIPALGSVAMLISLFAAFVFTPYLAISNGLRPSMRYLKVAEKREHREAEHLQKLYRRILIPLIENKRKRATFKLALWGTFLFTCSFFYFSWVPVKMLPLDNKPEFSVVIDMPEGTALPVTANLATQMASRLRELPEVTAIQLYAGNARPFDFNGMVRHYYLRSEPWQGELQVQLTNKHDRDRSSHEIAVAARDMLKPLAEQRGARIAVVEMPPGPPVLQAVVAEIHGPSDQVRRQFAADMTEFFEQAESTRDVDNYMRDSFDYWRFHVDTEKAVRRGISVDRINQNLAMALGGSQLGDVKQISGHEPIRIVIQVPLAERSQIETLGDLPVQSDAGFTVPLRELGRFERVPEEAIIYRKDLRGVEFVVADVGGNLAAPVYAMLQIADEIEAADYRTPDGSKPEGYWLGPPPSDQVSGWEWTGEWTVTFETFRDMGAAFGVALVLIYILVVWEFGNFRIPLIIMAPIPLTLLGIIPAHFVAFQLGIGGEFTATSMIGWIALAGIIVRNSILLVDFSINEVQKGVPVTDAVVRACTTRTRPIVITALALVAGSSVIFTDPIFQGMAISLASGVLVSTILTLIVIPLGCVAASKDLCDVAVASAPPGVQVPCGQMATGGTGTLPSGPVAPPAKPKRAAASKLKYLGEGLLMIGYALRGLGLLFYSLAKDAWKKHRAAQAAKSPVQAAEAVSRRNALRVRAENASDKDSARAKAQPAKQPTQQAAHQAAPAAAESDSTGEQAAGAETSAASSAAAANAAAETKSPARKTAARKTATQKSAGQQAAAKKTASVKKTPAKKTPAKKTPAAKKTTATRSSGTEAGGKGAESKTPAASTGRKRSASRRGIRLKTDDDQGDTGE